MKLFNNWKVIVNGTLVKLKAPLILGGLMVIIFITGCKKDSNDGGNNNSNNTGTGTTTKTLTLPVLTTTAVSSITMNNAQSGGNISSDGGATITARGLCWSTSQNPTTSDKVSSDGTGTGSFTSFMNSLTPNITYYIRAYATNSVGTSYGNSISFNTNTTPTLTTTTITQLPHDSVSTGGIITSDGGSTITSRGVCWATTQNPTITNNKTTDGTGTGTFISSLAKLVPNTTYYVRAYATNVNGTTYGNQITFVGKTILSVGTPYQGGIIGYILKPGDVLNLQVSFNTIQKIVYDVNTIHGIIIDTIVYNPGNVAWGFNGTRVNNGTGTSTSIGTGSTNTHNIVVETNYTGIASLIDIDFNKKSYNGYSDWFLPSVGELSAIFTNTSNTKISYFPNNSAYFTSSEATTQYFWEVGTSGAFDPSGSKINPLYTLIACRYF